MISAPKIFVIWRIPPMNFIIPPKLAETPPMTPAAVANHLIHLEIQYSRIHITHEPIQFSKEKNANGSWVMRLRLWIFRKLPCYLRRFIIYGLIFLCHSKNVISTKKWRISSYVIQKWRNEELDYFLKKKLLFENCTIFAILAAFINKKLLLSRRWKSN